jgi:transposase-like protein
MPRKTPPSGTDADLNLPTLLPLFTDESKARAFLESKRWPGGRVICPRCSGDGYALTPKPGSKCPVRPGVYKCRLCRQQFTVRIGTIFEESKIPLSKWLMAIHLMTAAKKGISSHEVARRVGVTQKTAWFVCHRIREAMREEPMTSLLAGAVEIDETYVGGKPRKKGQSKHGRGTSKKPVLALVERDGNVRAMPIDSADRKTLHDAAKRHVAQNAAIFTDDYVPYHGLGEQFDGGHYIVTHSIQEYAKTDANGMLISTNTVESFFALLKRAHYGIHHQMSKQHLHRYVDERSFMWDHRKESDGQRMVAAIKGAESKRLSYRPLTTGVAIG